MPEAQKELKKDSAMVDLDTTGNAVDVEINDSKADTKEVETKKEDPVVEVKEEKDEREEYSDGVKKRIDRLTYKIREAERREKEAVNYAQQVKGERDNLQTKFDIDSYIGHYEGNGYVLPPGRFENAGAEVLVVKLSEDDSNWPEASINIVESYLSSIQISEDLSYIEFS